MEQDASKYSRVELCQALGVSRSGWYYHQAKPNTARRKNREYRSGLLGISITPLLQQSVPFMSARRQVLHRTLNNSN
jgi:hypothetical protein